MKGGWEGRIEGGKKRREELRGRGVRVGRKVGREREGARGREGHNSRGFFFLSVVM